MPAFAYKYELNVCLELSVTDCVAVVYLANNTKPYLNCFELAVICLIQPLPIPTPHPHAHICGMLYLHVYVDVKRVLLLYVHSCVKRFYFQSSILIFIILIIPKECVNERT